MAEYQATPLVKDKCIERLRAAPGSTVEELAGYWGVPPGYVRVILDAVIREGRVRRLESGGYLAEAAPTVPEPVRRAHALVDAKQWDAVWELLYDYPPDHPAFDFKPVLERLRAAGQMRSYGAGVRPVAAPLNKTVRVQYAPRDGEMQGRPPGTPAPSLIHVRPWTPSGDELAQLAREGKKVVFDATEGYKIVPIGGQKK